MFVVVGATGNTGSVVVETLLNRKQPVRVVVRSADKGTRWKAKGAEVAVASLDDVAALAKAFEGTEGIYLMVPPTKQRGCSKKCTALSRKELSGTSTLISSCGALSH